MELLPLWNSFMPFMIFFSISTLLMSSVVSGVDGSLLPRVNYQDIQGRNLSTFFNSIPPSCSVNCEIVVGAAHSCEYLSCVCTDENAYALLDCVNCVVALTPYANGVMGDAQLLIDEWTYDYCKQFPTPALQIKHPGTSTTPSPTPTPSLSSASADFIWGIQLVLPFFMAIIPMIL